MKRYLVLSGNPPAVWLPACTDEKLNIIGLVVGPRNVLWSMTQWNSYRRLLKKENSKALEGVRLVEVEL